MKLCEGVSFFPLSERERRYKKIKDFLTPFLEKDIEKKPLSRDELYRLEINIRSAIKKLLPTLIRLFEDDPLIEPFLKSVLSTDFWDTELRELPTSLFMPKNLTKKEPLPGFHSLDLILGYYYSFKAMILNKENDAIEKNFNKAMQYQSFYALAYSLKKRIEEKIPKKKMLLPQIEKFNYLYGTPSYVYSAYILLLYAEKNKKIAPDLTYLAAIYLETADQLASYCQTAISNLEHISLQMGENVFKRFDDVKRNCMEAIKAVLQPLDFVKVKIEAADEVKRFFQNGNFKVPSNSNVYYIGV